MLLTWGKVSFMYMSPPMAITELHGIIIVGISQLIYKISTVYLAAETS